MFINFFFFLLYKVKETENLKNVPPKIREFLVIRCLSPFLILFCLQKNSTTYSVSKRWVTTNIACIFPFARLQHEKKKKKFSPNIFRKQKFFASFSFFRKKHFCVRVNNFPLCIFNHTQFINYYERNEGKIIFVNGFSMPFENSEGKFMWSFNWNLDFLLSDLDLLKD